LKPQKLAARETEFIVTQRNPFLHWAIPGISVFVIIIMAVIFLNMNKLIPDVNKIEQTSTISDRENSGLNQKSEASLMLIKEVRENEGDTVTNELVVESIEERVNLNDDNDLSAKQIIVSEADKQESEVVLSKPDATELELAQWQTKEQDVFFYTEEASSKSLAAQEPQDALSESGLLEIKDLIKTLKEKGEDDMALLNQLTILPSETAINHKTVARELTCELCSTIIYRPLKQDKNL
jgi:hypothetical protein